MGLDRLILKNAVKSGLVLKNRSGFPFSFIPIFETYVQAFDNIFLSTTGFRHVAGA